MRSQFQFNPIRTLGALNVLLTSLVAVLALVLGWPAAVVVGVYASVNAFIVFLGSFFGEPAVVSKAALDAYAAAAEIGAK